MLLKHLRIARTPLALLAFSVWLTGCALFEPSSLESSQTKVRVLKAETDSLREQIEMRDNQAARLQLDVLEQHARIQALETALQNRQQELDETRERLQRLDARILALTGRPQAAAAIAEAEAAYQVALVQGGIDPAEESAGEIRRLLQTGTAAYEAGDYAGAAELGDQVIRRLATTDKAPQSKGLPSIKFPEIPLKNPVAFRLRVHSHVRDGPGMGFAPRTSLPAATEVTGLATRGQWVKIRGPGDVQGWIYRKLLIAPD